MKLREANKILFRSFLPSTKYSFNLKKIKKFKKFKTVIIIGMGGSILGAKAIYSFLKFKIKKKFIFIDNLDQEYLIRIKKKYDLSKTLFLAISKSGNTNETLVNLSFLNFFLKKSNTIIMSENKNNSLYNFAKKNDFCFIKHHPHIGGRYSVFSEVGMLPAYLMGLNIKKFKKNLPKILNNKTFLSNNSKKISKLNFKKSKILVFFNYVPELENFLFWCQQLLAESLGKRKKGFIPVVSNAPKDHHSLLQLYLDGPKDKIFYIFSLKKTKKLKIISNIFGEKERYLRNKNYNEIKLSQKKAFVEVLKKNKTPFKEIIIDKLDENTIGKLFLSFIIETIILAKHMKVNAFDQPAVERVKVLTKRFLI